MWALRFAFVLLTAVNLTSGQSRECLRYHNDQEGCFDTPSCAYCIQSQFTGNRCNVPLELRRTGCSEKNIIEKPSVNETVPIEPGTPRNITVNFRLLRHPVDLYYLMDFSGSMYDDKESVVALSSQLIDVVKNNMSTDFTIGFGVFVDKPVGFFGSSLDYSFNNTYTLSADEIDLAALVDAIEIRSGGDGPEGQLEGMFQAAVCTEQIGWRESARRILVVATDADYHKAGDGLVYNLTNFDGECHLSPKGFYTEESTMDYPSEDQVAAIINDNQVVVIFAVSGADSAYRALQTKIQTSALGELTSDSSNIVELLVEEYNKIANRVELEQSPVSDEITVRYFSNCGGESYDETIICEELAEDGSVTFIIEFDLKKCPADPRDWYQTIRINPIGLPYFMDIALSLLCKA